jgi:hypothetical protein
MLMKNPMFAGQKGCLKLDLPLKFANASVAIHGGPYDKFKRLTDNMVGICVRAERTQGKEMDAHVPIVDFQTPTPAMRPAFEKALRVAMGAALREKMVYVGCMGGMGRTGLFLAVLAKAAGIPDPVEYVRANYYSGAVETDEQYDFVENYDVTGIQRWLMIEAWYLRAKTLPFIGRFLG